MAGISTSVTSPSQLKTSFDEFDLPATVTLPAVFGADISEPLSKEANSAFGDCVTLYVAGVETPTPVTVTVPVRATRPVCSLELFEIVPFPDPVEGFTTNQLGLAIIESFIV